MFVPRTFTVGRMKLNELAFVTCKFGGKSWCQLGTFERLCGFKPHSQRDPVKMMKKEVFNVVSTHDNVPTYGFKTVNSLDLDPYRLASWSKKRNEVLLEDPRGFSVSVTVENFFEVLAASNGNIENGVISRKLAYAWSDKGCRFKLVDAESETWAEDVKNSNDVVDAYENTAYLSNKDLVVGETYDGSEDCPGKFMYLGKLKSYDGLLHAHAIENKKYDVKACCSACKWWHEEDDLEREEKFTFCMLDYDTTRSNIRRFGPFVQRSSISKMLIGKTDQNELNFHMFNDKNRKADWTAMKEVLDNSLFFNKIDLSTVTTHNMSFMQNLNNCSFETFKFLLDDNVDVWDKNKLFPFCPSQFTSRFFMWSGKHNKVVQVVKRNYYIVTNKAEYEVLAADDEPTFMRNIWLSKKLHSLEECYNEVQPKTLKARLENGNEVPECIMMMMLDMQRQHLNQHLK